MKRREFMAASCALGAAAPWAMTAQAADAAPAGKEFYELRLYQLASVAHRDRLEQFLGEAFIPACNRLGIAPVGAFRLPGDSPNLYVLLPACSTDALAAARGQLMADAQFAQAGAGVLDAAKADPAFQRVESSLLVAFDGLPKLEVPTKAATRVLQLRIYESHSEAKALKKIDMFNGGGEIAIFRKVGLNPVFFGEALVGVKLPNLTYLLSFEDQAALDKAWEAFRQHPDWLKLKDDPQYADTVSNITNLLLSPSPCSQI